MAGIESHRERRTHVSRSGPNLAMLADPTRVRLLRLMAERSLTVSQLAALLGLRQPTVSQHMQRLLTAGFVHRVRQGREVYYQLLPTAIGDALDGFAHIFATPIAELPFMSREGARWPSVVGSPLSIEVGGLAGIAPQPAELRRLLFVCVGNSCRSQMAEGFARALGGPALQVMSAGLEPAGVNPLAVEVMGEVGIDLTRHTSKAVRPEHLEHTDLVVTLCGAEGGWRPAAREPYAWRYWPIADPAQAVGSLDHRVARFRAAREHVRVRVQDLLAEFSQKPRLANL